MTASFAAAFEKRGGGGERERERVRESGNRKGGRVERQTLFPLEGWVDGWMDGWMGGGGSPLVKPIALYPSHATLTLAPFCISLISTGTRI
jgi:hypothetical protein